MELSRIEDSGLVTPWDLGDAVTVVATMRIDALNLGGALVIDGEGGQTLETLATTTEHGQFISHLERGQLAEVIREPARRMGAGF